MIGVLGGTFDPVHFGHLRPALEIHETLALDEIRLVPCRLPPHRSPPQASTDQRLSMLEAAVRSYPAFRVDRRELERDGPSYTFDTLASLREELVGVGLCLLVGMDAFGELTTWHRWRELTGLCHLVVMTRPGAAVPARGELADFIGQHRVPDPARLRRQPAGLLLFQPVTPLAISASQVRKLLAAGRSPAFLMPEAVIEIINREGLYRDMMRHCEN